MAVLAAALLLTLPRQQPIDARFDQLLDQVRAGQVTSVQIPGEAGSSEFQWHEGPLRWYEASGPPDAQLQLQRTAAAPGAHGISFSTRDSGEERLWVQTLSSADEPSWLVFTASSLWAVLFFVMLATREHPYANRWAWFWLFTLGAVGPILMLFKEPRPLRLRPSRPGRPPRAARDPITGGVGLSYAIFWALGLSITFSVLKQVLS